MAGTDEANSYNLSIIHANKPVVSKTNAVALLDLLKSILSHSDQEKKMIEFPSVLRKVLNANYELNISKDAQRLSLYHRTSLYKPNYRNVVAKKLGIIFVNTNFRGATYNKDLIFQGIKTTKEMFADLGIEDQ